MRPGKHSPRVLEQVPVGPKARQPHLEFVGALDALSLTSQVVPEVHTRQRDALVAHPRGQREAPPVQRGLEVARQGLGRFNAVGS